MKKYSMLFLASPLDLDITLCKYSKGQLNSELIFEVIVSPKIPTKNYQDFCHGSLLEGRVEFLVIFGWHFEKTMTS